MARSYGALGYVTKKSSAAEIVLAVRAVLAGKTAFETCRAPRAPEELEAFNQVSRVIGSLTPQQTTVLRLLGAGTLDKQTAYGMSLTASTVRATISATLQQLVVSTRLQAVMLA